MTIVKVKEKYQVTLPAAVRKQINLEIGDILEATVKDGKITLTPKAIVEREIAVALDDVRKGRTFGPFDTAQKLVRSLRRKASKIRTKAPRTS